MITCSSIHNPFNLQPHNRKGAGVSLYSSHVNTKATKTTHRPQKLNLSE
nr:MAG TPA: hypothetical protein [Caudoviricetes sp.]